MAIAFPNSPTNGQTVTIGGVVYSWNSTTSTWDLVSSISTLDELQNVNAPTPSDNNLLAYDSGTSNWTNQTAAQAGVATATHTHPQSDVTNLTSDLAAKVSNTSFYAGGKNAILNAAFDINQRNFTSTNSSFAFTFDRWGTEGNSAGGTITWSAQTFTAGSAPLAGYEGTNFVRCTTASLGASNYAIYGQKIEDVRTFANQTVTISFFARAASGTPRITVNLFQGFGTGGSASVTTAGVLQTISTSWARYSFTINVPSIAGKTIGPNSFLYPYFVFSDTIIGTGNGTQNNTFDVWGLQVEAGSVATPFSRAGGTIQAELAACQRYYQRFTADNGVFIGGHGGSVTGTIGQATIPLPVTMRANPTSIDFANISWYNYGNGVLYNTGSFVLQAGQTNYPVVRYTHGSSIFTAGQVGVFSSNATGGFLGFSAEL